MFSFQLASGTTLSCRKGVVTRMSDVNGATEVSYDAAPRARAFYRRERNRKLKAPYHAFLDSAFLRWFISA